MRTCGHCGKALAKAQQIWCSDRCRMRGKGSCVICHTRLREPSPSGQCGFCDVEYGPQWAHGNRRENA